jgi:hypothetical protein
VLPDAGAADRAAAVAAEVCPALEALDTVEGRVGTGGPVEVRLVLPGTVSVVAEMAKKNLNSVHVLSWYEMENKWVGLMEILWKHLGNPAFCLQVKKRHRPGNIR